MRAGTEYYDAKVQRYVDFPITDVRAQSAWPLRLRLCLELEWLLLAVDLFWKHILAHHDVHPAIVFPSTLQLVLWWAQPDGVVGIFLEAL
jgi:hypothetical protein